MDASLLSPDPECFGPGAAVTTCVHPAAPRLVSEPVQQAFEEPLGFRPVPPILHQYIQHNPMLVHRASQVVQHFRGCG